ncbi:MAG: nitroreductase family protein [Armatimonadota bacterium]
MEFHVKASACARCGKCVATCPLGMVELPAEGPVRLKPNECLVCGHCLAVCPEGAISADGAAAQPVPEHEVGLEELGRFLRSRRSVRVYENRPVPRELLEEVLEAARYAPSAANTRSLHFTVVSDPERLRRTVGTIMDYSVRRSALLRRSALARFLVRLVRSPMSQGLRPKVARAARVAVESWERGGPGFFHNAPLLVIIHTDAEAILPRDDACYTAYEVALAAHAAGLGCCIIGFGPPLLQNLPQVRRDLGIPDEHEVQVVLTLGYAAERFPHLPPREARPVAWV